MSNLSGSNCYHSECPVYLTISAKNLVKIPETLGQYGKECGKLH